MKDNIYNARIESVEVTRADHSSLTIWVALDYGGSSQGFGGYVVYYHPDRAHDDTGRWVWGLMDVAGVDKLADVAGKPVRVVIENHLVRGLIHFLDDSIEFIATGEK